LKEDNAKLLVLERLRSHQDGQLKDIRSELKKKIEDIPGKAGSGKSHIVTRQIEDLKGDAMKVSEAISITNKKMDAIHAKHAPKTKPSPEVEAASELEGNGQVTATAKQLAFQLFCSDKRQEVALALAENKTLTQKASVEGSFAEAIDAELTSMWAGLPSELRNDYIRAARAALVVRDTTWTVAKKLFMDASTTSGQQVDEKALTRAWVGLPVTTQSRFFIAAQSIALGKPNAANATAAMKEPKMSDAVESLTKSVSDLAYDLFTDENWRWASNQVAAHQGPEVDAAGSDLRVYPDVQHLLATTYKNLSTSARHTYIDRAEQLMSTSFFAGHPPPSHSIGEVNSLEPPLHRTLLSFTFQFVGLGKTDADRQTRGLADRAVESLLHEHLSYKFRILQQNSIDAVDVTNALQRRYIISLVNNDAAFVDKAIGVVKAVVEQGELNKKLLEEGIRATVLFPIGGQPQLLTDPGVYEWTCKSDADCSYRGSCEEGRCQCKMEAREGKIYQYGGYDCSFGPSVVCPKDCSFHGVCQENGECRCASGYVGAGCEMETCVNDCSGHGVCFEGMCACEDGWIGPGCSHEEAKKQCKSGCSGHGKCDEKGACQCDTNYSGEHCGNLELPCPVPCANGGNCNNGTCVCGGPWKGDSCQTPSCEDSCSGHGTCEGDGFKDATCNCNMGWAGPTCACASSSDEECSGHGMCQDGECFCHHEWGNEACAARLCTPPDCSGHGMCQSGQCECEDGWKSDSCGVKTCLEGCEAHGKCNGAVCECDAGFLGAKCSVSRKNCPLMCSESMNQGACRELVLEGKEESVASCVCAEGFGGPGCELKTCDKDCSGHGICRYGLTNATALGGACHCESSWFGDDCASRGCLEGEPEENATAGEEPKGCSGHGTCSKGVGKNAAPYECNCEKGWIGGLCEIEASLEECAVCCLNKCLSDCHKEHSFQSVAVMTCFHQCQPTCVEDCQLGEIDSCPGDKGNYDHLVDALSITPEARPVKKA
jgi:hypothetical protein